MNKKALGISSNETRAVATSCDPMRELKEQALSANRESKQIEFKTGFDPQSAGEWCEITKDIVALANSGGGIIVFGLDSFGKPTGSNVSAIRTIDPAEMSNKLSKYIGTVPLEVEICDLKKAGQNLAGFIIDAADAPVAFQKPGTYDVGGGKQKTAFGQGTVYFRHGGKSEPGTSDDLRKAIDRRVSSLRRSWLQGVRKVVQAPHGSQVFVAVSAKRTASTTGRAPHTVRVVNDPKAPAVLLTRDPALASTSFVHEEISDGIFDEINNIIDANKILAHGQSHFFFGPTIYYRIYAERAHVLQDADDTSLLFQAGLDFYAPCLHWVCGLPESKLAESISVLYLHPRVPAVRFLIRLALLLGSDFSDWLGQKWDKKWKRYSQPPLFYFAFRKAHAELGKVDPRLIATNLGPQARIEIAGEAATVAELLAAPQRAGGLLSKACMNEFRFEGKKKEMRGVARNLDCLAYGAEVQRRAPGIHKLVAEMVGDQAPADPGEPDGSE